MSKPFKLHLMPSLFVVVSLPVLIGLGNWQMERLVWKKSLIVRVEKRLQQAPIVLPASSNWLSMSRENNEYRRVKVAGKFDHSKEQYWHSNPVNGRTGVQVITPLVLEDGRYVLVNRGFVPTRLRDLRDPAKRQKQRVTGRQTLSGLLHWSGERKWFDPLDEPQNNFWFVRDLAAMAENMGVTAAPFFIDADIKSSVKGGPIGGQTRVSFHNRHLGYAMTWYGLAVTLVIIFILWHILPVRKSESQQTDEQTEQ